MTLGREWRWPQHAAAAHLRGPCLPFPFLHRGARHVRGGHLFSAQLVSLGKCMWPCDDHRRQGAERSPGLQPPLPCRPALSSAGTWAGTRPFPRGLRASASRPCRTRPAGSVHCGPEPSAAAHLPIRSPGRPCVVARFRSCPTGLRREGGCAHAQCARLRSAGVVGRGAGHR